MTYARYEAGIDNGFIPLKLKLTESASPVCELYLNDIKTAAKRISGLTKKLAKLERPNFVDYLAGTSMLDLDG